MVVVADGEAARFAPDVLLGESERYYAPSEMGPVMAQAPEAMKPNQPRRRSRGGT